MIYNFTSNTVTLSATGNTIFGTSLVYIANKSANHHAITVQYANAVTKAVFWVPASNIITMMKAPTDLLVVDAGSDCIATAVHSNIV
jgi:hypothetical protein